MKARLNVAIDAELFGQLAAKARELGYNKNSDDFNKMIENFLIIGMNCSTNQELLDAMSWFEEERIKYLEERKRYREAVLALPSD